MERKDRRRAARAVEVERRRQERRVEPRLAVDLWVESDEGDATYFQRVDNLSAGGAYFTKTMPHPVGTRVRLRFSLPDAPGEITCGGEIVSVVAGGQPGMGVKFLDLPPDVRGRIRSLVERPRK